MPDDPKDITELYGPDPKLVAAIDEALNRRFRAATGILAKFDLTDRTWRAAPTDTLLALGRKLKLDVSRFEASAADPPEESAPGIEESGGAEANHNEVLPNNDTTANNSPTAADDPGGDDSDVWQKHPPAYMSSPDPVAELRKLGPRFIPIKEGLNAEGKKEKSPTQKFDYTVWDRSALATTPEEVRENHGEGVKVAELLPGKLVFDFDGDVDAIRATFEAKHNVQLPATFKLDTDNGAHWEYLLPEGVELSQHIGITPGLDIKTGPNNYHLVPPSPGYEVADDRERVMLPDEIIKVLRENGCRESEADPSSFSGEPPFACEQGTAHKLAREYIDRYEPAIEGEDGNGRTCKLFRHLFRLGVYKQHALELTLDWLNQCDPPWKYHDGCSQSDDARRIIDRMWAGSIASGEFGTLHPDTIRDDFDKHPEAEVPGAGNQDEPGPVEESAGDAGGAETDDDAFNQDSDSFPPPGYYPVADQCYTPADIQLPALLSCDYLVKGWLDKGVQAQAFGHWGTGKTFVSLHIAAHIAAGQSWFGQRVRQCGVLYCGYEGERALRKRLWAIQKEFPHWPAGWEKWLRIYPIQGSLALDTTRQHRLNQVIASCHGGYPGLVIIDPLRNALGGSDSDPGLTEPFLQYCRRISKATGATVLTVHHTGHAKDAQNRGRGDSGIEAAMDAVLHVEGNPDTLDGRIYSRKQRDEAKGSLFYSLKVVNVGADSDGDIVTTCIAEQAREPARSVPVLKGKAARFARLVHLAASAPGTPVHQDDIKAAMVKAGFCEETAARPTFSRYKNKLVEDEAATYDEEAKTLRLTRGAEALFDEQDAADREAAEYQDPAGESSTVH